GRTVGTMNFDNANAYTIAGSTLTLATSSGNAALNVLNGSHVIDSNLAMTRNTTVDTASGTTLTVNGAISGSTGLTKVSAGTLVLGSSANSYSGGTTINGGTLSA